MISQESIERVKSEASLVDIVSETVKLRRSGANYTGLCPFHSERSPSFFVRESANSYHCFGCSASGNVISFVMATRAMSFPDAVEFLAGRFGIELKYDSGRAAGPRVDKEKLFSLCSAAQLFFRRSLMKVKGGAGEFAKVGEYLRVRGLSADAINHFGIGYCPNQRGVLIEALTKAGFDQEMMLLSGLIRRTAGGELYELFRGRLLFPIYVDAKRIAGFGGRIVPGVMEASYEKQSPKYVNSPETPIYHKSKTFYGLPQALPAVRETGEVYVVEGYMDVVGLAMRGVHNVVACCGTALTEQHLKRLSGICSKALLLFDGDEAGLAAASKSFPVARNADVDVMACFLPDGIDPDDFARQHGSDTGSALRDLPRAFLIDVYVDGLLRSHGCDKGEAPGPNILGKVCDELAKSLRGIQREVVLSSLITRAARRLKIDTSILEKLVVGDRDGIARGTRELSRKPASRVSELSPEEDQGTVGAESAARPVYNRPPSELPRSDVALLRVVMVLRNEVLPEVISNPDVCDIVAPESMRFLLGLKDILDRVGPSEEGLKEQIKEYLQALGSEWVRLWKEAHTIMAKSGESAQAAFQKTLVGFRREKLMRLLKESQQEVSEHLDDPERQAQVFDRIRSLKSQLDTIARG